MTNAVLNHVKSYPPGWIFSAADFDSLATRNTIDQNLLRLTKLGHIRKISTGLFCIPLQHVVLGQINPSLDDMVQAYARKFGYNVHIHPAKAANLLGLSQQVPAQNIYLTDAPSRSLVLGGQKVFFQHVCPRKLLGIGTKAGLIVQALYALRSQVADPTFIEKIKRLISAEDALHLKNWLHLMPGWMKNIMTKLL